MSQLTTSSAWIWLLIAPTLLVIVLWPLLSRRPAPEPIVEDFVPKQLLTDNEMEFYGRLLDALPRDALFIQVAMSALMEPRVPEGHPDFWQVRNKFAQKFVDFVVCDPSTLDVIAIIELDDRTHDAQKDADRDAMLASAGYTVLRWQSTHKPSPAEIAAAVDECR
jgi:hypothetical protein